MREDREHTNPLPEPDLKRTGSDTQRGYGTPEPDSPEPRTEADGGPGTHIVEGTGEVRTHPEPDAENIMPAEDQPGTL